MEGKNHNKIKEKNQMLGEIFAMYVTSKKLKSLHIEPSYKIIRKF